MMDKFFKILGADFYQYGVLLKIGVILNARVKESGIHLLMSSPAIVIVFYTVASLSLSLTAFGLDNFSFTVLTLFFSMTMIAFSVIIQLEVIINPNDYRALAHMPISSSTYFFVKLTQMLIHLTVLVSALNIPPSIFGIWTRNGPSFFPAVYLPVSFIAAFFVTGLIASFYGYLIKLYKRDKFRDIITYSQMVLVIILPLSFYLFPRLISASRTVLSNLDDSQRIKWLYLLPYGWFAGFVHFGLGNTGRHFLFLSVLAVTSTFLIVFIPLWRISLKYTELLSHLEESPGTSYKAPTVRVSQLARLFKQPETLAGFELVSKYLKRDRSTKLRIYVMLAMPFAPMIPVIKTLIEYRGHPFAIGLAVGVSIFSFYGCAYFISYFLSTIKFSEHWKAAWIFTVVPLAHPGNFFKGAKLAMITYLIAPYFVIFTIIAVFFWGPFLGVIYVLPGIVASLCYLSFYSTSVTDLPFSREPQPKKGIDNIFILILGIVIFGALLVGQYLTYRVDKMLYVVLYSVTIGTGLILFKIGEWRNNRRFSQLAVNVLQSGDHFKTGVN